MKKPGIIFFCFFFLIILIPAESYSQQRLLDDFEDISGWRIFKSDGVDANVTPAEGLNGNAVKYEFNFIRGSGYGGIQKQFPLKLPENFELSFYLKASCPDNNFEIKFLDKSGENVWWVNNRNFSFPREWKKITVKKRHISFAWGPAEDKSLKEIDKIEFTVTSFNGGRGYILIDDLNFRELPPVDKNPPRPVILSLDESEKFPQLVDNNSATVWMSNKSGMDGLLIDFTKYRETGGLFINWVNPPDSFLVYTSENKKDWEKIYSAGNIVSSKSYIRLLNSEARYLKIILNGAEPGKTGISDIKIFEPEYSENLNRFFINMAKDYPRGYFPRYFYEEASYWTVNGVNSDVKEALINEDGMIEIDKAGFSIEPVIYAENKLITWNDVEKVQSLLNGYLPIPKVSWRYSNTSLDIECFSEGMANKNSTLYVTYTIKNTGNDAEQGKLYLLLRPFQVNPYYQELNLTGGVSKISKIAISGYDLYINDNKVVSALTPFNSAGAMKFDEGNIFDLLSKEKIPAAQLMNDSLNLGSGIICFDYNLAPGKEKKIVLAVPYYARDGDTFVTPHFLRRPSGEGYFINAVDSLKKVTADFWEKKLSHVKFNLPESANDLVETYKANLAYILINRDYSGIQPGSRSYERSWIRDGSLTSSALLKSGIVDEVKEFIKWYSSYQYENGKIPCVVDLRGPDPVPENDSHGEFIFLVKQFFNFTKDTSLLRELNPRILKTVDYINYLTAQRSTEHYKNGNDSVRAYYGIMPESISHEGYSAKPMHSYWDDFFTIRGLKDAADIQEILGENKYYKSVSGARDDFRKNLYNSLRLAIKTRKINYIPGCVELGDFDATSTTIALYPCNEYPNLPQPYLNNTFDIYYKFFKDRRDGVIDWINYTPYEIRIIGSFIFLDQPERAHELISFFMKDRLPVGWKDWAEVVWNNRRKAAYIGDMPHTWVGSDFINAVRAMFVYENDYDSSLVLGAGLYKDWIDSPGGISFENMPTYYGEISCSVKKDRNSYLVDIYGDADKPSGHIILKNFNGSKFPSLVTINGRQVKNFTNNKIIIDEFPAALKISY